MKLLREIVRRMILEMDIIDVDRNDPEFMEVAEDASDIFMKSYDNKGGFPGIESAEGVKNFFTNLRVIDADGDGEADAAMGYYKAHDMNKKASASGSDGTTVGKKAWRDLSRDFFSEPGCWSEMSDAPAYINLKKLGMEYVDDPEKAKFLVDFEGNRSTDFEWKGDDVPDDMGAKGWYTRTINNKEKNKIIVGNMKGYNKHKEQDDEHVSEAYIRNLVRSLLLETRANLSIRPVMKAWWKIASEVGVPISRLLALDLDFRGTPLDSGVAGLIIPKEHKDKVFESLTDETQEWVLKHWKTKEYFGNMISGVKLGIVKSYESPRTSGQKRGGCFISLGTWDEKNKTWVGGMDGYLTMRTKKFKSYWQGWPNLWVDKKPRTAKTEGEISRTAWKEDGFSDLNSGSSTLVHEFQHWFQESVMYPDKRTMQPTKATKGGNFTKPKGFKEKYKTIRRVTETIMKQYVQGVDLGNPKKHPYLDATMYEITDNQKMKDTLFADGVSSEKWPLKTYCELNSGSTADWLIEFFENTLKIPLGTEAVKMSKVLSASKYNWIHNIRKALWGSLYSTNNNGQETPLKLIGTFKNGKSPDVKQMQKAMDSALEGIHVDIVPKSHIVKNTITTTKEVKPNKSPVPPTLKQIDSNPAYVIFSRLRLSKDKFKKNSAGISSFSFDTWRNPLPWENRQWADQWDEYDAESRNYLSKVVHDFIVSSRILQKAMLKSETQAIFAILHTAHVDSLKLNNRINPKLVDANKEELVNLAKRVSDRFTEVIELYDPQWYRDNSKTLSGYGPMSTNVTDDVIDEWLNDKTSISTSDWGGYWKFLREKIIGGI